MSQVKLSVILVTRNEEKKIRRCLESVRWADEIVVVDQSSTDATVALCKEYTDKVNVVAEKGFCEPDRITAASLAANQWLFYLDADEEVSPGLRKEIEQVLSEPEFEVYYLPRKNIFMGKWIRGSGWYPGYVPRLFKKGSVRFPLRIHEDIKPLCFFGYLKCDIIHYTAESQEEYLAKLNRYTTILAVQEYQKGARITPGNMLTKLFLIPAAYAFKKFILKRGFKDGFPGMVIAALTFLTVFLMNVKLWEKQKRKV
jgi:glycosyltransferase involved in cell wall biosynthesis